MKCIYICTIVLAGHWQGLVNHGIATVPSSLECRDASVDGGVSTCVFYVCLLRVSPVTVCKRFRTGQQITGSWAGIVGHDCGIATVFHLVRIHASFISGLYKTHIIRGNTPVNVNIHMVQYIVTPP